MDKTLEAKSKYVRKIISGTLLVGLVSLSSCVKTNTALTLTSAGKLNGTVKLLFSEQVIELSGLTKEQLIKQLQGAKPPKGVTMTEISEPGFVGEMLTFKNVAPTDLSDLVKGSTYEAAGKLYTPIIKKVNGKWEFKMDLDLTAINAGSTSDSKSLVAGAEVLVSMTFPGKVLSADSTGKISGKSVSWKPAIGKKNPLKAVAATK